MRQPRLEAAAPLWTVEFQAAPLRVNAVAPAATRGFDMAVDLGRARADTRSFDPQDDLRESLP